MKETTVDDRYTQWKSMVPVLYDWLANHNLLWPSLSCRWGPQTEQATYKNRQRLYLSEQTDGTVPNTLVIANCEIVKPRVAAAEHISQFNEEARSPFVKKFKTIIHPGEVNRIRELPQNSKIIATHTDSPDVLIWDIEAQPNRQAVLGSQDSRPDLTLTGHLDNAEFALAMSPSEPFVLSGGKDQSVILWSIHDHISGLATEGSTKSPGSGNAKTSSKVSGGDKLEKGPTVGPRGIFEGHDDTVEDVQSSPSSAQEFCSVGDDSRLILWDARLGSSPVTKFNEEACSPFVKKFKTIIHPGEVNRIRELPQNSKIIATHTDNPDVLIWDIEAQPNRQAVLGSQDSRPDLTLTGHLDNAEFAPAMSPSEPFVLSGGKDKSVILWSIQDHISGLATEGPTKSPGSGNAKTSSKVSGGDKLEKGPTVGPRGIFEGHDDTVEDVQFSPASALEFCSVGDDFRLILWDARLGSSPVIKVKKAHNADIHCVGWNPLDVNIILTGSADSSVRMFDRRKLTSGEWSPDKSSVFGSSAEDGILNIWDHEKVGKKQENSGTRAPTSPGLFFRHAGYRDKIVVFHWNTCDPWTIVSVSDDGESTGGGGTLQIWRMIDLIYRPEDEVLTELEDFKTHILKCSP